MLYLRCFSVTLFFVLFSLLCPAATNAQPDEQSRTRHRPIKEWVAQCRQPEREALMKNAERRQYTLRRVEFVGLTYTPDRKMRRQMSKFNEGDIFSRAKLVESLAKMNRLRNEIYPVRLTDVMVHLNEQDKTADITICFRSKRR